MALAAHLLEILCCPESHQSVREISSDELSAVNAAIRSRAIRTIAGEIVHEQVSGALVREDGKVLYPIREGIPILLVNEAFGVEGYFQQ